MRLTDEENEALSRAAQYDDLLRRPGWTHIREVMQSFTDDARVHMEGAVGREARLTFMEQYLERKKMLDTVEKEIATVRNWRDEIVAELSRGQGKGDEEIARLLELTEIHTGGH